MPYLLLMIEPVGQRKERTEAEGRAVYDRMVRFGDELNARGMLLASQSLKSQDEAARVTLRGGRAQVLDGPFAEAKEMVGGFFLVDCKSFDEAVELAKRCPAAEWCTVEVRAMAPCFEESTAG